MNLTSPQFLIFVVCAVIAYHANSSLIYRRFVLVVADIYFIASYVGHLRDVVPLLAFVAAGYCALQAITLRPGKATLAGGIAIILATFIVLKQFSFLDGLPRLPFPYLTVGLSYILFRMIHVMADARSGDLPDRIGPVAFFRYTCNFLSFVSGPIQRYQDFARADKGESVELDRIRVYAAFSRVVTGLLKFAVIAVAANYIFLNLSPQFLAADQPLAPVKLVLLYAVSAASYTGYLYFNFSGYMDMVIGIGWLLGQELPENFNKPFVARNFLEFWQRWHMTLSDWFRIYVFNPLMKAMLAREPAPWLTPYLGVIAFFITFLIMGIWHGTTPVFVIYGLLMGAGASANKLWQVAAAKRLGRQRYRALTENRLYIYFCRGLTIAYFAMALTCLWVNLGQFIALFGHLGAKGTLGAFVLLTFGFAAAAFILDSIVSLASFLLRWWRSAATGLVWQNFTLALRILVILAVTSLANKAPDFVYKAF